MRDNDGLASGTDLGGLEDKVSATRVEERHTCTLAQEERSERVEELQGDITTQHSRLNTHTSPVGKNADSD